MIATLSQTVRVARRFMRSIRVDADLGDPAALDGFICSQSAAEALLLMGRHKQASGHGAFTWTGPYGSGKSSLAIALCALLGGRRSMATSLFAEADPADAEEITALLRPTDAAWRIVPIVGRRADPAETLEAATLKALKGVKIARRTSDQTVAEWIAAVAKTLPGEGLVLVLDEMGKFLEHAASDAGDIHILQDLAEAASRANGRLIVVGILHQAFDEYAHRMSREARDEWSKVQGRFIDISISLAGDEQIELIARAIETDRPASAPSQASELTAQALRSGRVGDTERLARRLEACWPLHPLVAALLGPISRRRFGQSQRSIFGFLTSAEPYGFQEYLGSAEGHQRYGPERLWHYLRANLEPAILASPDGHRWSTAVDAVERCEGRSGSDAHLSVLKTIALLDLFKDRSGLQASPEIVRAAADLEPETFAQTVADLIDWSVIVHRKHLDAYAIYAGSDFDIEKAIAEARQSGVTVDYRQLARQASIQPVLAKRHYEATGSLRWFEIDLAPVEEAQDRVRAYRPAAGAAGLFLILVSTQGEPLASARKTCKAIVEAAEDRLVIAGWTRDSVRLREMASELAALEHIRVARPELEGDSIARREVDARISRLAADLEERLSEAINLVDWVFPAGCAIEMRSRLTGPAALSVLASQLADWRYPKSPRLRNELVNRTRASSNAAAATRVLLRAMVENGGAPRLGIEGFPAEAGLFCSLLEATGLYVEDTGVWTFASPKTKEAHHLHPMWSAAEDLMVRSDQARSLGDLYALWRAPPYGARNGLLPILAVAFLLAHSDKAAVYLDGVFRPQLDAFLVDRILQDPSSVALRLISTSDVDADLVAELSRQLSTPDDPVPPSALDVARALVQRIKALPNWTTRTQSLSKAAIALRTLCRASNDPNQLLFEDLPKVFEDGPADGRGLARSAYEALQELEKAYPAMLEALLATLIRELRHKDGLEDLHHRARNVQGLSGNFRLDALAARLQALDGSIEDIEGLGSLAASKPSRDWVDRDVDAARIELAALAQQFLRAERFGHLKGRADGRTTLVVYMSDPNYPAPAMPELDLDEAESRKAEILAGKIADLIEKAGAPRQVALGALAKYGLSLAQDTAPVYDEPVEA